MKKYTLLAALAFSALTVTATPKENTSQGNPQEMDKFITELMDKMTLHEKIGQLNLPVTGNIVTGQAKSSDVAGKIRNGEVGGLFNLKGVKNIREVQKLAVENSRLGIPLLFGMDVIHGYETVFPIPLALSCSWDMEAIEKSARIAAIESSADGICWTFSPMVDICRDARWGRVSEGNGEDPFLGSAIAQAMIRGYQGKDMSANNEIMACVKHFALYGAGEAGRDYNTVDMSRNRMFNEYFPPYKAAVEAGVGSAMTSFNEIDGVPATALAADRRTAQPMGLRRLRGDRLYSHLRNDRPRNRRPAGSIRTCLDRRNRHGHGSRRIYRHTGKIPERRQSD